MSIVLNKKVPFLNLKKTKLGLQKFSWFWDINTDIRIHGQSSCIQPLIGSGSIYCNISPQFPKFFLKFILGCFISFSQGSIIQITNTCYNVKHWLLSKWGTRDTINEKLMKQTSEIVLASIINLYFPFLSYLKLTLTTPRHCAEDNAGVWLSPMIW